MRLNSREDFEKWNQDTDLSVLKMLKIGPNSTLDAIVYMTTDCHFQVFFTYQAVDKFHPE